MVSGTGYEIEITLNRVLQILEMEMLNFILLICRDEFLVIFCIYVMIIFFIVSCAMNTILWKNEFVEFFVSYLKQLLRYPGLQNKLLNHWN